MRTLITFMLFVMGACLHAAVITEDFESGFPSGWSQTGVTVKKDNNSNRAAMSTDATLTSHAVTGFSSVSYKHRGSGNGKKLVVETSADDGATWTQIGETTVSSSSTYGTASHSATPSPLPVRVRFTCKSATIFLDDIEIRYVDMGAEPTAQCSLAAGEVTGSSISLAVTPGNGTGRLVAYAPGTSVDWAPADGVSYTGTFPKKAGDVTIICSDNVTSVTATDLKPGTAYTFIAYEYNGDGEARNYLTSGAASLTASTAVVPVIDASASVLDFKNTRTGGYKELTLTINGYYLSPEAGSIAVSSSSPLFTVSATEVPYSASALQATVIVRFSPVALGQQEAVLTLSGGGATTTVTLRGNGAESDSAEYYLAPDGDDSADGSIEHPWMNLQKAVNVARPGDVIYCRGGRYHFTTRDSSGKLTVRIKTSGTAEAPITITAYPGEHPIFDFEQQLLDCNRDRSKVGDRGMLITGNYWHLYGLHIMHAADNGIKLEGSHNRLERCEFSYNLDSGLQLGFGHNFADSGLGSHNDGSYCAYNDIIDCDSHHNCDYDTNYGSDADGFACKMHNGIGNRFIRCRAWRNGDDAWDLYETDFSVTLIECWAWESGKAEDHTWVYDYFDKGPSFSGNGNGIKLGGNGTGGSSKGVHYAYNCVAFGCNKSGSVKGFDCNSHKDGHVIVGGLAFDNGYDFMFESGGSADSRFHNNVCFGRQEILVGTESHNALGGMVPNQGKTFYNNVVTDFSRSDYESLAEADALAPRGEDGSLPVKFARLRSGSKLVDAGIFMAVPHTDEFPWLDQPVYGAARDLGPYELQEGEVNSSLQMITTPGAATALSVSGSGRGAEMLATVTLAHPAEVTLNITSLSGITMSAQPLGALEGGASYTFPIATDGLTPGFYIVSATIDGHIHAARMLLR